MGETLRPVTAGFNRSLSIETRAERLTGDPGAVLLREVLDATGIVPCNEVRLLIAMLARAGSRSIAMPRSRRA